MTMVSKATMLAKLSLGDLKSALHDKVTATDALATSAIMADATKGMSSVKRISGAVMLIMAELLRADERGEITDGCQTETAAD